MTTISAAHSHEPVVFADARMAGIKNGLHTEVRAIYDRTICSRHDKSAALAR